MLKLHMPAGWSSSGQLRAVWLGHVTWRPRLWCLPLENGIHSLLPQAVLSGNPPLALPQGSGVLVLPEDLAASSVD